MNSSAGSTSCASRSRTRSTRAANAGCPTTTRCRSPAGPSSTRACSWPTSSTTYYPDLHDPDFESALALVHQRFSTNTFPTWSLAHPYRMIAHNGEINTLRGNNNWMAARQASVSSKLFGDDINRLWPISYEGQSDTACFDNALEFLVQGGYSLAHAMMMMIPEAWAGNPLMDEERRAFYEYNAALMEPWDGPAAIAFTNGRQIGATLDRNGLRPARYFVTRDDRIIMASEMGVLPIPEKDIVTKWRLQPGKMLLVDLDAGPPDPGRGAEGDARQEPSLSGLAGADPDRAGRPAGRDRAGGAVESRAARSPAGLRLHPGRPAHPDDADGDAGRGSSRLDGHRHADLGAVGQAEAPVHLLQAELRAGDEPADRPDPRRAGDVARLDHRAAAEPVRPRRHLALKRLEVRQPILTNDDLEKIRSISEVGDGHFKSRFIDTTWPAEHGAAGLQGQAGPTCALARKQPCAKASTSSSCPTAAPAPSASRFRRCSPARPFTIT